MLTIFTKPIQQIDAADVNQIVQEGYPEGYQLEFKKTLPNQQGKTAPWLQGKNEVGDYARDEILSELVGFANAQGGFVIVGIDETQEKPPRAKSIEPIPRIGELARRMEDQIRSCVDAPLSRFHVHPVEIDAHGNGVLILHTGSSYKAPHRLTTTRDAYAAVCGGVEGTS